MSWSPRRRWPSSYGRTRHSPGSSTRVSAPKPCLRSAHPGRRRKVVRRAQLEHVLRAACTVAKADAALVIGSQAILGSFGDEVLPEAAVRSIEVDVTFLDDPSPPGRKTRSSPPR
jgi:hypothetical protein